MAGKIRNESQGYKVVEQGTCPQQGFKYITSNLKTEKMNTFLLEMRKVEFDI